MTHRPYGLIADVHLHKWSAFAQTDEDGQNNRLSGLLSEITRAAIRVGEEDGRTLIVAGDLFHVRGQLSPSVLNPTMDVFREIIGRGMEVIIIPGNHDLEGRDSARLGSAVTALEGIGCKVMHGAGFVGSNLVVVPWMESVAALKEELLALANLIRVETDLIIHAPVNGVIMGIPDHGLDPAWLAGLGFKRVFAGHYHNHVSFPGQVHSIGALAHHTWSDVGSKAGFLIVHEDRVDHYASELPSFVDVLPETASGDIMKAVKGNFARVKVTTSKLADIENMRKLLTGWGALGVIVLSVKKPTEERVAGSTIQAGASIEQSVSDFVKSKGFAPELVADIEQGALRVLAEAEVA